MNRITESLRDAANALLSSPLRLLGAVLPMAVGVGLLVAVTSLAETAGHQVSATFDRLRSTEVLVSTNGDPFLDDWRQRISGLPGVVAVEHLRDHGGAAMSTLPDQVLRGGVISPGFIYGVDRGGPQALRTTISGRLLDLPPGMEGKVALVGRRLANSLDLVLVDGVSALFVENKAVTVVGVIETSPRDGRLLDAVVLTEEDALAISGPPTGSHLVVEVEPGAGAVVSEAIPLVLRPEAPDSVAAIAPPDATQFRREIEEGVRRALLALGWVSLVVALLVVLVSSWTAVSRRVVEIGLHRALGAKTIDVVSMMLAEGVFVGLIGGLAGASVGVIALVTVAARLDWAPVLPPDLPLIGLSLGVAAAVVATVPPAWRAARLSPVAALRSAE